LSFQDSVVAGKQEVSGKVTKLLVQFSTTGQEAVMVKVGLSTAGEKGAITNLDTEFPLWILTRFTGKRRISGTATETD
jgi:putative alpha-1,2-mannosidase